MPDRRGVCAVGRPRCRSGWYRPDDFGGIFTGSVWLVAGGGDAGQGETCGEREMDDQAAQATAAAGLAAFATQHQREVGDFGGGGDLGRGRRQRRPLRGSQTRLQPLGDCVDVGMTHGIKCNARGCVVTELRPIGLILDGDA